MLELKTKLGMMWLVCSKRTSDTTTIFGSLGECCLGNLQQYGPDELEKRAAADQTDTFREAPNLCPVISEVLFILVRENASCKIGLQKRLFHM